VEALGVDAFTASTFKRSSAYRRRPDKTGLRCQPVDHNSSSESLNRTGTRISLFGASQFVLFTVVSAPKVVYSSYTEGYTFRVKGSMTLSFRFSRRRRTMRSDKSRIGDQRIESEYGPEQSLKRKSTPGPHKLAPACSGITNNASPAHHPELSFPEASGPLAFLSASKSDLGTVTSANIKKKTLTRATISTYARSRCLQQPTPQRDSRGTPARVSACALTRRSSLHPHPAADEELGPCPAGPKKVNQEYNSSCRC